MAAVEVVSGGLTAAELRFVTEAAAYLERPGFLLRVANLIGRPAEMALAALPRRQRLAVGRAVEAALRRGLALAVRSLGSETIAPAAALDLAAADTLARRSHRRHRMVAAMAGAGGGLFGLPGLVIELPITTSIMLRAIASVARAYGEDLDDPEVRLECLAVLSHGGPTAADDALESAYLGSRVALADAVRQAATFVARASAREVNEALARGGAPALVRLVAQVTSRFNVVVSEKLLAESLPLVGAAGGALINAAFTDHFAAVARYHFGLRRLERRHGAEAVQTAYRLEAARRRR